MNDVRYFRLQCVIHLAISVVFLAIYSIGNSQSEAMIAFGFFWLVAAYYGYRQAVSVRSWFRRKARALPYVGGDSA